MSRNDWNGGRMLETPPYFTGVAMDGMAVGHCFTIPFDNDPITEGWEFFSFPFYIIDLPFSLVADVLYIPSDFKYHKRKVSQQCVAPYVAQSAPSGER